MFINDGGVNSMHGFTKLLQRKTNKLLRFLNHQNRNVISTKIQV